MKIGDIISLDNRYQKDQDKLELVEINGNEYKFKLIPDEKMADFWRRAGDDPKHPEAIDPPGGPYMSIGRFMIGNLVLSKIDWFTIGNDSYLIFIKDGK